MEEKIVKQLPVHSIKKELLDLVRENKVVIVVGEAGSGKTTLIPKFLLEKSKEEKIACTQPRRISAISVSKRVSEEMGVVLGEQVGYSVRFENVSNEKTVLKYMTDGMLLREAMFDQKFSKYTTIILDEAHERTISTDILMGLLKDVLKKRNDLRVVIMSATLNQNRFKKYFLDAPCLNVSGRIFPVEVFYSKIPESDYIEAALKKISEICQSKEKGDILLFLTGEGEIEDTVSEIKHLAINSPEKYGKIVVIPLYSALSLLKQQEIFKKFKKTRKIIVATNIAETSITIDGIVFVIDPGFSKQKVYNPHTRVESLSVSPISRSSAIQRAGRAGRTKPGKAFRLYTKVSFEEEMTEETPPEVLRSNLSNVVLIMKMVGVSDLIHFDFMDPPSPTTLIRALEQLNYLGALNDEGELTSFGKHVSEFPLDPQLSVAILSSSENECLSDLLIIVSFLSTQTVFFRPLKEISKANTAHRNLSDLNGDHLTFLKTFFKYKKTINKEKWCKENFINRRAMKNVERIKTQLSSICKKIGLNLNFNDEHYKKRIDQIKKSLLYGFFMQVVFSEKKTLLRTVKDNLKVSLHSSCVIRNRKGYWAIYNELVHTDKLFVRTVTEIDPVWLFSSSPSYYDLDTFPNGWLKSELQRIETRIIEPNVCFKGANRK